MNRHVLCAIACAYWFTGTAYAAPVSDTASSQQSQQHFSAEGNATQRNLQDLLAKEWGLTNKEYERYQNLMQEPRGIWSPGLDPLTALGVEARSDEERRRFAELQVKAERQRVEKELAYQRAYDEAYHRVRHHRSR